MLGDYLSEGWKGRDSDPDEGMAVYGGSDSVWGTGCGGYPCEVTEYGIEKRAVVDLW